MKIGDNVKVNLYGAGKKKHKSLVLNKHGELTYLEHLLKRLKSIPRLEIVLSASPGDNCEELTRIAQKAKCPLFFDSETERHQRLLNTMKKFKFDAMLDLPAIYCALGIEHTKAMINDHCQSGAEITVPVNFPAGGTPLSVLSLKALEKMVKIGYDKPYYKDLEALSDDLEVNFYELEGQRTYFETSLILATEKNRVRVDYLLTLNPATMKDEEKTYEELNKQDKHDLFFKKTTCFTLETTNLCNLRCIGCVHGMKLLTREKGIMSLDDFKRIIRDIPEGSGLNMFGFGEPFINKDIYQMFNLTKNMRTNTSTNGHYFHSEKNRNRLVESHLDHLVVAIDGASEETYSKYRKRGMFTRIINDIRKLIELRDSKGVETPQIDMQFILFKFNEHEAELAGKLADETGFDNILYKTTLGKLKGASKMRVKKDRSLRVFAKSHFLSPFRSCLTPMIMWNGDVSPCCHLFNGDLVIGNMVRQTYDEIKQTDVFKEFVQRRVALEEDACAKHACYCYS